MSARCLIFALTFGLPLDALLIAAVQAVLA